MKRIFLAGLIMVFGAGCTPTIQVAVPSQPMEINLDVKIEHKIKIEVDKDLEDLFEDESDIF